MSQNSLASIVVRTWVSCDHKRQRKTFLQNVALYISKLVVDICRIITGFSSLWGKSPLARAFLTKRGNFLNVRGFLPYGYVGRCDIKMFADISSI